MKFTKQQRAHNVASGLVQHYTNAATKGREILTKGAPDVKVSCDDIRKALGSEQLTIIEKVNEMLIAEDEGAESNGPA